jgi:hypothetical protein
MRSGLAQRPRCLLVMHVVHAPALTGQCQPGTKPPACPHDPLPSSRNPQVSPSAAAGLSEDSLDRLFLSALRCSGADARAAAPAGAARALLDAGLAGCDAHQRRHPAVARRPPYDDFRLVIRTCCCQVLTMQAVQC